MTTDDPMELIVAAGLKRAGVRFIHESEREQTLDFFLPDHAVYIECKQFHSERIGKQISDFPNVIVIQGRIAAHLFASMITGTLSLSNGDGGGEA